MAMVVKPVENEEGYRSYHQYLKLHDLWFWLNILSYTVWFFFSFFFEKQTSKFQKINLVIWNIQNFPEFLHTIFGVWQLHNGFSRLLQDQDLLRINAGAPKSKLKLLGLLFLLFLRYSLLGVSVILVKI